MRHRVLVVGTGSIGERHTRCFQQINRSDIGICEPNAELRAQIAQRYDLKDTYGSLDDAMREKWGAAVICSPAQTHIPIATQLAEAGVNLLIEKPLSTSTDGVDALVKLVDEGGLAVSIAYVWRASREAAAIREALKGGRFGTPKQIIMASGSNFPHFRPAYRDTYYNNRSTGGGAIQDALTHGLNLGEWLVGPIDRAVADAAHQVLPDVVVEDTVNVLTRHGSVMGAFSLNQFQAPSTFSIEVNCDKGSVRFEPTKSRWSWCTEIDGEWNIEQFEPEERDAGFRRQANAFLDCVEGKAEPACTLKEGLQTLKVNLAILASIENDQQWQKV